MADERYEWLDKSAAERLLRGEPVEAPDEHARDQAARLTTLLHGIARCDLHEDDDELPGEAAALAAFRKARAEAADPSAQLSPASPASDASGVPGRFGRGSLDAVRMGRGARGARSSRTPSSGADRPRHGSVFRRPVRLAVAAAVAGCALGGVAVAAGAGVLPTPFRSGDPMPPAVSSPTSGPQPLGTQPPSSPGGTDGPTPNPLLPTAPPGLPAATSGTGRSPDAEDGGTDGGTDGGGEPEPGGTAAPGSPEQRKDGEGMSEWRRKSLAACKDFRQGTLAPEARRRLEADARGPERVKRFCDRLLNGDGGGESNADADADGNGNGDADSDRDGDGNGRQSDGGRQDGKGDASGASFTTWGVAPADGDTSRIQRAAELQTTANPL
ncbi:hypothetical protein QCN29_24275 [Streptomyces sp. HNM0663]|uniref:Extensin n=1 Tax=Streptomyces chengmaiensis TaxID=3040919 RepID=A0ABT6HSZ7_9ACTN|nr:hypothetical protein [Streptomyces chengmaiensis]MDH2391838.1 hypothetical protein [Streptomyces chengmaiensis]